MQLYKKLIISGTLTLKSGLHIGDSKETTDIGGVDSPVVRRKDNNEPYIPGSSLKGKIRSLLDIAHGEADTTKKPTHPVGELFGALGGKSEEGTPSRIIVRDAYLTEETAAKLRESEFTDMPFTEIKFENTINRITGVATNPRQFERVPAGAQFNVEFVINVIAENEQVAAQKEKQYLKTFNAGIKLLEHDYLGGSGSRGYGQVTFQLTNHSEKTVQSYLQND